MDDDLSSSNSSSWRRTSPVWSWMRSTRDVEHRNLGVDVRSTLGRFLPPSSSSYATFVSRPSLPPPLLPLTGTHRATWYNGDHHHHLFDDLKLERVPTPTRADQLLVAPGDERDVTVCFQRTRMTESDEVKPVRIPNDSPSAQPDNDVMSFQPTRCQHNPDDVIAVMGETDTVAGGWTATVVSENSGQIAVGDWTVTNSRVRDKVTGQLTGARPDDVDGKQTANELLPSVVHLRLPPPSPRQRWTTAAAQRRTVEFDAKYWERRRRNNEAAKRSRDVRRANERRVLLRAALLERENARLRSEVDMLTDDALRLHYHLLCSRTFACSHCHRHASD